MSYPGNRKASSIEVAMKSPATRFQSVIGKYALPILKHGRDQNLDVGWAIGKKIDVHDVSRDSRRLLKTQYDCMNGVRQIADECTNKRRCLDRTVEIANDKSANLWQILFETGDPPAVRAGNRCMRRN
jgi:hypothetical protein